jgi:hypothetical protein
MGPVAADNVLKRDSFGSPVSPVSWAATPLSF